MRVGGAVGTWLARHVVSCASRPHATRPATAFGLPGSCTHQLRWGPPPMARCTARYVYGLDKGPAKSCPRALWGICTCRVAVADFRAKRAVEVNRTEQLCLHTMCDTEARVAPRVQRHHRGSRVATASLPIRTCTTCCKGKRSLQKAARSEWGYCIAYC